MYVQKKLHNVASRDTRQIVGIEGQTAIVSDRDVPNRLCDGGASGQEESKDCGKTHLKKSLGELKLLRC